jgi:transposase
MPPAKPPEFRRRAIALARSGDRSIARIAADLGIAESCLRRWLKLNQRTGAHRSAGDKG